MDMLMKASTVLLAIVMLVVVVVVLLAFWELAVACLLIGLLLAGWRSHRHRAAPGRKPYRRYPR